MTQLSRRSVLQSLAAIGAVSPMAACTTTAGDEPFFASKNLPVGIQLYTLGDLMRTDFDGTLAQVARIGYREVETASYAGKTPQELRAAFDKHGLKCTSAHIGMRPGTDAEPGLTGDLKKLAADMNVMGVKDVVCPAMAAPADIQLPPQPNEGFRVITRVAAAMTPDHWKRMAQQFNAIGKTLKASGLRFGYHNHNFEFTPVAGTTGLELLIKETDPDLVMFELDVGWAAAAGVDPAAFFQKHSGRFGSMHVKDIKASTQANLNLNMDPTEVGSGRLDWAKILPAAHKAGVRRFFVEQEAPFEHGRLEAAAICYNFLNTLKA